MVDLYSSVSDENSASNKMNSTTQVRLGNGTLSYENGRSSPEPNKSCDGTSVSDKTENGSETVIVQDMPFTIKVRCPDSEPFELPVSR